jgi:hypothetical protein
MVGRKSNFAEYTLREAFTDTDTTIEEEWFKNYVI